MRRIRIIVIAILITATVTAFVMIGGFYLWLNSVYTTDMTLIQLSSDYRAEIPSKSDADAKLYSLGRECYLLVLKARSSKYPEGYYINLHTEEIGLPDFPDYIPFLNFALVDRRIYDGFPPEIGAFKVKWDVKNQGKEIHLGIIDFKIHEHGADFEKMMSEHMPIAHRNEIILRKK